MNWHNKISIPVCVSIQGQDRKKVIEGDDTLCRWKVIIIGIYYSRAFRLLDDMAWSLDYHHMPVKKGYIIYKCLHNIKLQAYVWILQTKNYNSKIC